MNHPILTHIFKALQPCQYEHAPLSEWLNASNFMVRACPYLGCCVLDDAALQQCKSTAFIVNVSRKQLVSDAICDRRLSGGLAGYAVDDVIDPSPPSNLDAIGYFLDISVDKFLI